MKLIQSTEIREGKDLISFLISFSFKHLSVWVISSLMFCQGPYFSMFYVCRLLLLSKNYLLVHSFVVRCKTSNSQVYCPFPSQTTCV